MTPKTIFGSKPAIPQVQEQPIKKVAPSVLFNNNIVTKSEKATNVSPSPIFNNATRRFRPVLLVEQLKEKYKDQSETILARAYQIIMTTNCEDVNQKDIINWGYDAQQKYAVLIEKIASISNSTLLAGSKMLINEIGALIENDTNNVGFIKKMFKKNDSESIYQKIVVKTELLKKNVVMLHNLLDIVASFKQEFSKLQDAIAVDLIAGEYLIQNIPVAYKDAFQTRIVSLESLNIQFKVTKKQVELLNDTIIKIISIVQDTLSVEVPIWYNNKAFENISEEQKQQIITKIII